MAQRKSYQGRLVLGRLGHAAPKLFGNTFPSGWLNLELRFSSTKLLKTVAFRGVKLLVKPGGAVKRYSGLERIQKKSRPYITFRIGDEALGTPPSAGSRRGEP